MHFLGRLLTRERAKLSTAGVFIVCCEIFIPQGEGAWVGGGGDIKKAAGVRSFSILELLPHIKGLRPPSNKFIARSTPAGQAKRSLKKVFASALIAHYKEASLVDYAAVISKAQTPFARRNETSWF